MSYNPYLQAQQGLYPQPSQQIQSGQLTPEQLQAQLQANQQIVQQVYTQPALQRSNEVTEMAEELGTSVGSQLAQANQAWNNPYTQSSQERLRSRAQDAKQRNAARLGDEEARRANIEDGMKIATGSNPDQVRKEREDYNKFKEQASDQQRIENYEVFKQNQSLAHQDFELMRDIMFASPEDVKAKYQSRPELLNYILGQKEQRMTNALQATAYNNTSSDSVLNVWNALGATVAGVGENVGGYTDLYNLATLEGQDRIDALNNGVSSRLAQVGDDLQNAGAKASDTRAHAREQYEQDAGLQAYAQAIQAGESKDVAENRAEFARTGESINSLINNPYQITKEVAQFVPDMVVSLLAGGGITKGFTAVGKEALEKSVKHFDDTLANKVKQEAIQEAVAKGQKEGLEEIGNKAVKEAKAEFTAKAQQEISKQIERNSKLGIAGFESVNNVLQNAPQGYQTASQNIMSMPLDKLKETQGFKDMKAENPNLSDKEIQTKMADEAGLKGYAYAGLVSAGAGALGSNVEANIVLGRAKSLGKKLTGSAVNAAEEAVEEGGSVVAGNIATNQETKDKTVSNIQNAGKSAVMGAVASGTTTAAASVPAGFKGAVEKGLDVVTGKQEKKLNKKSNEALNTVLGSDDDSTSSITGKKFSETNFGKAYNNIANTLKQDSNYGKFFKDSTDYTGSLKQLNEHRNALIEQAQKETKLGNDTKAKSLLDDADAIGQALDSLMLSLHKDLTDNVDSFRKKAQEINTAMSLNKSTDEVNKLWDEYDALLESEDKVKGLKDSTLYKILDQSTRDSVTSNEQITAADILGSGKFSLSPKKAFQKATIENSKLIQQVSKATSPEEAYKHTLQIASNIAQFSASLASKMPTNIKEANEVKEQVRTILNQLDGLTTVTQSKDLAKIVDNFKRLVDKPIPSGTNIKAYTETMFGGTNVGMMDYLTRALANGGTLTDEDHMNLSLFMLSQAGKIEGLKNAIAQLEKDPSTPVKVVNRALRNTNDDPVMKNQQGEDLVLHHVNKARQYLTRVTAEANFFNKLGNTILGLDLKNGEKIEPSIASNNNDNNTNTGTNTSANLNQSNPKPEHNDEIDISWSGNKNKHLSNLAPRPFEMKDRNGATVRPYRSVEHYYQTWKSGFFDKNAYRSTALKPKGTKSVDSKISEQVMKDALLASFKTNPEALNKLLATGDKPLTHTMDKGHWGTAFPRLLMEVREELKDFKPKEKIETTNESKESNNSLDSNSYQFANKDMKLINRLALSQQYIADKVAMAYDSIKKQWSTNLGNELTEFDTPETDTVFTLNTSKGEVEYRIPMSAMVEMNRKGYDPTVNLLDAVTTKKEIQSKEVADAFMFNPTKDGLGKDNPIGEALVPIAKNIRAYFRKPLSIFNPNYSSKLGKFHLVNGLLNLVSMEEHNGKVEAVIPAEVQLAFAKAQAIAMANYRDLAFGKDSQYEDYWNNDLNAEGEPRIFESTTAEELGVTHSNAKKEQVNLDHYSQLGITRNDFIEMLGDNVLEQLGMSFNKSSKEYSEDIAKGIQYSLGLELYNAMLNQGLLSAHDVVLDIKENGLSTTKTIPYVNFKLNLKEESSENVLALQAVEAQQDLNGMSLEQANAYLNKHPMLKATAVISKNLGNEYANTIFGSTENAYTGVYIGSLQGQVGKKANVQQTVRKSDTKNDITTTNNPELDSAIAHMNNVGYALNLPLFNLLQNNTEALQLAFGYETDIDTQPISEATKKAKRSKNNSIIRAIGLLNKFVNQAKEQGLSEEDMMFKFHHHFVPNMRTMLQADMNPQSNKIVREMLRLVQSDINESDGTITGEMKLDLDIGSRSKFYNKGEPRTIDSLINTAKSRFKSKSRNFAIGFLLALNQGLDIGKIEKTKSDKIFTDVQDALSNPEHLLYRMTDLVWAMQQANEQKQEYLLTDEDRALLQEFGSELGNGAPRAMNAIQSWANFKYRGTSKDKLAKSSGRNKFSTSLLLEADGIGNGLHNITRQFAVKFSPAYFNTLKRTGMVTLDVLSQISVKRLNKSAQDKLRDSFEGSAGMFMPTKDNEGNDTQLRDIYEVIADKLSIEANAALNRIKDYAQNNRIDLSKVSFKEFNKRYYKIHKLDMQLKADLAFLMQLHTTGMATNADKIPLNDLIYQSFNNIALPEDFLLEIKRNLAKAGVTPTVYGGQLEGIASQLFGDTKGNLIKKGDKIIELAHQKQNTDGDTKAIDAEIEQLLNEMEDIYTVLGIEFRNEYPEKAESNFDKIKGIVDSNLNRLNYNKRQFINSLKDGLANQLRNAVQDSYIDEFAMLNFAMAQDDIAFANFTEEFTDKVEQARKARNAKNKYAINDPRNHSPLSRKEIRDVISTITSAPVIATAFNANSVLFEDVFEMGNSLVKLGSYNADEKSTINSNIANTRGKWSHNITTQLMRSYRRYVAAGAANATGTIPSTESKTQATLAERLMDMLSGITSLNVFDGIDGLLYFRDLLGQIANEQTNKVHLETSILNNFYDKFTKSGIADVIENTNVLSKGFYDYLSTNNVDFSDIVRYAYNNKLSRTDAKYIMAVAALVQMQLENSKIEANGKLDNASFNIQTKSLNTFKSQLAEAFTDAVYNNSDEITLGKKPSNPEYPSFKGTSFIGEDNKVSNTLDRMYGIYNNVLKTYIHRVASTRALKHIEATQLPVIINQFAGGNRGFFANPEKLSSTGKRFKDYVINKYGASAFANQNFLIDSNLLSEFLANDPEIQKEYSKKYEAVKSKLHKPYITRGKSKVDTSRTNKNKVYSMDNVLDSFKSYMDVDTPLSRIAKGITSLIKHVPVVMELNAETASKLIPKGKRLVNLPSREASINYLIQGQSIYNQASGISISEVLVDEVPSENSKPTALEFILLNPENTFTKGNLFTVLVHESIHNVLNNLVNYVTTPEFRTELEESNPELATKLNDFTNRLTANIDKFVSKNQNLSAVQEHLQNLRDNPASRHHYETIKNNLDNGLNAKTANIANYIYFFQELINDNLPDGFTPEMLTVARVGTLHELLAYSMSDSDTTRELSVHKEASWISNLTDGLKNLYQAIRSSLRGLFGIKEDSIPEDVSMLDAMLESVVSFYQESKPFTNELSVLGVNANKAGVAYHNLPANYVNEANAAFEEVNQTNAHFSMNTASIRPLPKLNKLFRENAKKAVSTLRELENGQLKYGEEAIKLLDSKMDKGVNNVIAQLRSKGYKVTLEEEQDIKLAYKLNIIGQTAKNDISKHISKAIQENINNVPDNVIKIVNKSDLDTGALMLALMTLSSSVNNSLSTPAKTKGQTKVQKKLQSLSENMDNLFDFTGLTAEEKYLPTLEKLQIALTNYNKHSLQSEQTRNMIVEAELQKAKDLLPIQDAVNKLSDELPKPLATILAASSDLLTGKDYLPSGAGQDSMIGQLVRKAIRNHEELYGRNTVLSKIGSWIVGQDSATQYSAKLKGEASQLNAIIRERLSTIIPESIRAQFKTLDESHEKALDKVLMPSQLNRLGSLTTNVADLLESQSSRNIEIAQAEANISTELDKLGYTGKQKTQIENFIRWQTRGLGDWVVNREAKVANGEYESNILPNAKVISSLIAINGIANKTSPETNSKVLRKYVEQLVTLHSLSHHNQKDLDTLAELYRNDTTAFRSMMDSMDSLENELEIYGEDSYAGFDGHVMNKRNPHKDIKVLNKSVKGWRDDLSKLQSLGYELKATLPNGDEVWYTDENPINRFTTGVFNMTEHSIRGMDIKSYTPLHSYDSAVEQDSVNLSKHPALKDANYYDGLSEKTSRRTIIDNTGHIVGYSTALPKSIEDDLIETYENGIDAIGNAKGRITEELATEVNNKTYVDMLLAEYDKKKEKGQGNRFIRIDGKYKPKGTSKADLEFAERINSIYRSLPASTRKHIDLKGGLYIERTEIDNLLGYNQASWADVFTGKSGLPEPVQQMIRSTIGTLVKIYGGNPVKFMKRVERILAETASLSKDFILTRSGVVALGNMTSNLVHLWNTGVPLKQIPELMREGFIEVRKYNRDYNRTLELRHLMNISNNAKEKAKYEVELKVLEKALQNNPVLPLVNEGILTNISSASGVDENDPYGFINSAQRKLGFTKFKQTKVGKAWGNVMVQEGSATHAFMNATLDYGDFVAKYALYKHLTKNRQFNSDRALNVIRDEFINYGLNRGRVFDWANKVGLTWFLSYKLGIQKIFLRNLRRNFLRSAAVYSGAKVLGTNQVVPAQNLLFDGSLRYQTDPSNLWEGFKTHWIGQVFG